MRRRLVPAVPVLIGLLVLVGGGSVVGAEGETFRQTTAPLVGRTSSVCPVAGSVAVRQQTTVTAVVSR
ncbi:MAG: hypothetical protein ACLGIF_04725, partial [Actinomycetes bacterium]